MAIPFFADIYKLFKYATTNPASELFNGNDRVEGVGVGSPDAKWDIQSSQWANSRNDMMIQLSDAYDFIDIQSVSSRKARYKEYDRLEVIPEIYSSLNTYADESCLAGNTQVATPFGYFTLKELVESKKPEDRFLVYCWDFDKNDFAFGWAYHPRFVKRVKTVRVVFDNGKSHICTPDHRFLMADNTWKHASELKFGMEIKAFHRVPANRFLGRSKSKQFARVLTNNNGWMNERQLIDEWKTGQKDKKYELFNLISRNLSYGLRMYQISKKYQKDPANLWGEVERRGFSYRELRLLIKRFPKTRRIVGVWEHEEMDVYDLSVDKHENFATDCAIVHNCQTDEKGHVFHVRCSNKDVKQEADFLVHKLLELDDRAWSTQRNLCKYGDHILETVINPYDPKKGIVKVQTLPIDTMYRIETIKGRLVEYQQSQEGPDYKSIEKIDIEKATEAELSQAKALRFHPEQIIHLRIGDERKLFYPYGISMIESARGPANQLRQMEDAMLVYRLIRAPERRVFYIDVGTMQPNRIENMIDRLKDQFKKKKTFSNKRGFTGQGASGVEERWNPMSPDEDIFVPLRPNSQTRIETLPGASNLGETDDVLYFRSRLYTALQFPRNFLTNEDAQANRLNISQQDVKFARLIERLQKPHVKGVRDIIVRHLKLRGFPKETYQDLEVTMTQASDWRQINRNEVSEVLYNRSATLKGSQLMSDYDILTKILNLDDEEARRMVARNDAQKLKDVKIQVIGQNPEAMGLIPMQPQNQGTQIGANSEGPNPTLPPNEQQPPPQEGSQPTENQSEEPAPKNTSSTPPTSSATGKIADVTEDEIKKYDMELDNDKFIDEEEVDTGEIDSNI